MVGKVARRTLMVCQNMYWVISSCLDFVTLTFLFFKESFFANFGNVILNDFLNIRTSFIIANQKCNCKED